jgi:hypothetical protein
LVDGNQTFCKPELILEGAVGVRRVAQLLSAEVLHAAKSKHKNDLPSDIQVHVSFFLDLDRLSIDLAAACCVTEPKQLSEFIRLLNAIPLFSVVDCAGGKAAVDGKIKGKDLHF